MAPVPPHGHGHGGAAGPESVTPVRLGACRSSSVTVGGRDRPSHAGAALQGRPSAASCQPEWTRDSDFRLTGDSPLPASESDRPPAAAAGAAAAATGGPAWPLRKVTRVADSHRPDPPGWRLGRTVTVTQADRR